MSLRLSQNGLTDDITTRQWGSDSIAFEGRPVASFFFQENMVINL